MDAHTQAQNLFQHIAEHGGATVSRSSGSVVGFDGGYQVALDGAEVVLPAFTPTALANYMQTTTAHPHAPFFGFWMHDGRLYADVSVHVADRTEALAVGRHEGQIAVWDWTAFDSVKC